MNENCPICGHKWGFHRPRCTPRNGSGTECSSGDGLGSMDWCDCDLVQIRTKQGRKALRWYRTRLIVARIRRLIGDRVVRSFDAGRRNR